jgi:hypothetical protein
MANKKITDLTELTEVASDDYLEIVDTSANASKKISRENLIAGHDHDSDYLGISAKAADSDKLDGLDSTDFATAGHDHDSDYLGITAKAADSDKLDNIDSSGFVQTSGDQTIAGIKTFSSFPVTPSSAPSSDYQTANKKYVDDSVSPLGAWQSYTVSWTADTTNPSIGNGTLVGRYTQIGKTCILIIGLTMGSTTTYGSGNWSFSLPKTAKNTSGIIFYGVAHIRKLGTANYERIAQISPVISTTVIKLFNDPTQGSNSSNISATVPFTWGDGDALGIEITYEME